MVTDNRLPILNTYVSPLTMDETIARVEELIAAGKPVQHVAINASKINLMRKDESLRRIVNNCPIISADGASILLAARILGVPVPQRVTGCDLFQRLVAVAGKKGYSVYLLGARQEVVEAVAEIFRREYPGLRIAGYHNGYFTPEEEPELVKSIAASGADMLFMAISSPKKEYWLHKYLRDMKVPFVMGVGGSFDVVAGVTKRAPLWMQRMGLEWLCRLLQEPSRLWKRYLVGNTSFLFYVLRCKFSARGETT